MGESDCPSTEERERERLCGCKVEQVKQRERLCTRFVPRDYSCSCCLMHRQRKREESSISRSHVQGSDVRSSSLAHTQTHSEWCSGTALAAAAAVALLIQSVSSSLTHSLTLTQSLPHCTHTPGWQQCSSGTRVQERETGNPERTECGCRARFRSSLSLHQLSFLISLPLFPSLSERLILG